MIHVCPAPSFRRVLAVLALAVVGCGDLSRGDVRKLSDTGLYADPASNTVADSIVPFEPAYELWSDGTEKQRWIFLPPGTQIDTSNMDHWIFPVGTRVWKEFRSKGRRLETRWIERTGPGPNDYSMGAFVWDAEEREAVLREEGARDVRGTSHDVPASKTCLTCHGGEPGRILGFSAIQLEREPKPHRALGVLHANCGHCHSETGVAFREVDLVLRLNAGERDPKSTAIHRTAVGVPLTRSASHASLRIAPGAPESSGLVVRMRSRRKNEQMPPLATEHADVEGIALVSDWIASLGAKR